MGYDDQNVGQLRKLASSRKISGRAEMNREELVSALIEFDEKNEVTRLNGHVVALESRVAALEARLGRIEAISTPLG